MTYEEWMDSACPDICPLCGERGRALFTSFECPNAGNWDRPEPCNNYSRDYAEWLIVDWQDKYVAKWIQAASIVRITGMDDTSDDDLDVDEEADTNPSITGFMIPCVKGID